ncbi:MAG: Tol-Pal system protein TolB, partial [Pseudomonadota bacterium]
MFRPLLILPLFALALCLGFVVTPVFAQSPGPLRIEITDGVVEPLPFAIPTFVAENAGASDAAQDITRVVAADLRGTGLFREIPA